MEFPAQKQPCDPSPETQNSVPSPNTANQLIEASTDRRTFLRNSLALPVITVTSIGGLNLTTFFSYNALKPATSTVHLLAPTPTCKDNDEPTPEQIEGPYFKPHSPQRTNLRTQGMRGTPLHLTGFVLSTTCQPIAYALLDFWHANHDGQYDNIGYTLRGHQYSDRDGRFHLETIIPGIYPGRTRHIHVKVQPPHQPILTTQLYFPWEARLNASDFFFRKECLMNTKDTNTDEAATFSFVLHLK